MNVNDRLDRLWNNEVVELEKWKIDHSIDCWSDTPA